MGKLFVLGTAIELDSRNLIVKGDEQYTIDNFIADYRKQLLVRIKAFKTDVNTKEDIVMYVLGHKVTGLLYKEKLNIQYQYNTYNSSSRKINTATQLVSYGDVFYLSFVESTFYELFYEDGHRYDSLDDDYLLVRFKDDEIYYVRKGTGKDIDRAVFNTLKQRGFNMHLDMTYADMLKLMPKDIVINEVRHQLVNDGTMVYHKDDDSNIMYVLKKGDTLINQLANVLKEITDAILSV